MEKWFVSMKKADFTQIAEKYHISPIIARLIRNRDILGDQNIDYYLNGTIADLHDGMLMKNMDTAVEILEEKIREGEKIRVIGDAAAFVTWAEDKIAENAEKEEEALALEETEREAPALEDGEAKTEESDEN
jgi:hypothetical protein